MEKYQENPQLLDPLLQQIVAPLTQRLRDVSVGTREVSALVDVRYYLSRLLWVIASVRYSFEMPLMADSYTCRVFIDGKFPGVPSLHKRAKLIYIHTVEDTKPSSSCFHMLLQTLSQLQSFWKT